MASKELTALCQSTSFFFIRLYEAIRSRFNGIWVPIRCRFSWKFSYICILLTRTIFTCSRSVQSILDNRLMGCGIAWTIVGIYFLICLCRELLCRSRLCPNNKCHLTIKVKLNFLSKKKKREKDIKISLTGVKTTIISPNLLGYWSNLILILNNLRMIFHFHQANYCTPQDPRLYLQMTYVKKYIKDKKKIIIYWL